MIRYQCLRCRSVVCQVTLSRQALPTCRKRCHNSAAAPNNEPSAPASSASQTSPKLNIETLLSKPTWSVKSLLPPTGTICNTSPDTSAPSTSHPSPTITSSQLYHLLTLSALPQPTSSDHEIQLLHTLNTQLHFVRVIQKVDTTDVTPLVTLRDETDLGVLDATVGLQHPKIREALGLERRVGRRGRVRRVRKSIQGGKVDVDVEEGKEQNSCDGKGSDRRSIEEREWDPLGTAQGSLAGRYFIVEGGNRGDSNSNAGGLETRVEISAKKSLD